MIVSLFGLSAELVGMKCFADLCDLTEILNLVWPHFFNGCNVTRPSDEWLLQAGEWEEVKLRPGEGEGPYDSLPHVIGTLTKKQFEPLQ